MDLTGALVALVMLGPLMLWTAILIRSLDGRPVLFRHSRPGLGGKPFTMIKFRTMRDPRSGEAWGMGDGRRVTRLGRILRSTSLDELPELWCVLRGDMSLVGPRPLLMEHLTAFTPVERRRLDVRPGLTGWAVVNGRHTRSFEERLALDVWYVDHRSLSLDLRILAMTFVQLLRSDAAAVQDPAAVNLPERFAVAEEGLRFDVPAGDQPDRGA
jgi:sugar transferase EpsL